MGRIKDIAGQRFGKLIVQKEFKRKAVANGTILYRRCMCDCGTETFVPTSQLNTGHTKSCGCLVGEFRKLKYGMAVRNQVLDDYKRGAESRGYCWNLTNNEFDKLIGSDCYYCGIEPSTVRKARRMNGDLTYNGIDRIDNGRGYVIENCVACCKLCNRMKSNLSEQDFLMKIKNIAYFRGL